jgi:hypothetical protein
MRARMIPVFLLVLCLAPVVGCGSKADLIETPAKDMNLSAGDLGSGYGLMQEWGKDEFLESLGTAVPEEVWDANFRMFEASDGMVITLIISAGQLFSSGDMRDLVDGIQEGILEELPDMGLETLSAPAIGDEANLLGTEMADLGLGMYILSFRKANVLGVVVTVSMGNLDSGAAASEFGKTMDSKIQ